jgi:hypothetical protein
MKMIAKSTILLSLVALFITSCSQNKPAPSSKQVVPQGFVLSFGEGGGIAGVWQGFSVSAEGVISRWQGRVAGSNPKIVGLLSKEELLALFNRAKGIRETLTPVSEKGDLTFVLRLTLEDSTRIFTWTTDQNPSSQLLMQFYRYCRTLIEQKVKN